MPNRIGNAHRHLSLLGLYPTIFVVVLLIGIAWTTAVNRGIQSAHEEMLLLEGKLKNVGVTLSHNVARTSSELDTLLQFMRAMRKSKSTEVPWSEIVSEDYTLNRHTVQIAVIAKDGMMVTSTKMLNPQKPVDLSDREHYRVHLHGSSDQLFISKPVIGRASKKWSVQYTRPLYDSAGAFDGAIVVSFDPDKFTQMYEKLDLGNGGVIIVGTDSIVRAASGLFSSSLGSRIEMSGHGVKFLQSDGVKSIDSDQNRFKDIVYVTQDVEGYPLKVIVAAEARISFFSIGNAIYLLVAAVFSVIAIYIGVSNYSHRRRELELLGESNAALIDKGVAEAANKTKGEFLAIMSHEIRTPLNGVLGSLDLISSHKLPAEAMKSLDVAKSSSEYLLSLIDDILVYSKLEAGKIELDKQPFSLLKFIGDLEVFFRPLTESTDNKFCVQILGEIPGQVLGDQFRLRQVLLNLLGNANKFTSAGSIQLTVRSQSSADQTSAKIQFSIEDTGVGIPIDKQALVFEKFQSLDASYSRRSDGTGLGLAICNSIMRAMGSRLNLVSEYGVGSTFFFEVELPKAENENLMLQAVRKAISKTDFRTLSILLAEDNETNAYIATECLVREGHSVVRATDGVQAVARANAVQYDLILMDVSMPNMDGLTASLAIRSHHGPNQFTPIVALTAHAESGTEEKIRECGMNAYLTKPIRRERLLIAVQEFSVQSAVNLLRTNNALIASNDSQGDLSMCVSDCELESDGLAAFLRDREIDESSPLFRIFITEMDTKRTLLDQAIAEKNIKAVGRIAHAVLGSSSTIGAAKLAAHCRLLEAECRSPRQVDWRLAISTLHAIDSTVNDFKAIVATMSERKKVEVATVSAA